MSRLLVRGVAAFGLIYGSVLAAHAAPIANLTCTGSSYGTMSANLSYYNLSAASTNGTGDTTTTVGPLVVHAALSQFQSFYLPFFHGTELPSCTLTSSAGGTDFKISLTHVNIESVSVTAVQGDSGAVGGAKNASAYVNVSFIYKAVQVDANGPDDGGTTPNSKSAQ